MLKNQALGLILIAVGVIANNYVYWHDIIVGKHQGLAYLGTASIVAVILSIVVIFIGVLLVVRAPGREGP